MEDANRDARMRERHCFPAFLLRDGMSKTLQPDRTGAVTNPRIVVLTGFMGSGKTSTGQALAELLEWEFVDLDSEIEAREGLSIRQLFQQRGEPAFRAIEHEVLRVCVSRCARPTVIALGGGAFVQPNNAEALSAGNVTTVFLETPLQEMLQRCCAEDAVSPENPRPLAADAAAFRRLYEARLPSYRAAAVTINTSGKSTVAIAGEIAGNLRLQESR